MKRMRLRVLAAVSIVLVVLSSCAGLPRRGGVTVVERSTAPLGGVVLDAKGPTVGASPEELIQGFLRASSVGVSDNFRVARQFLTPEAAARWNPSGGVNIFSDSESVQFSQTTQGAVLASVPALGRVDSTGHYTAAETGATLSREFSLMVNEDGEWRIAALDDSVMMAQTVFSSLYVRSPLYFLNSEQTAFVPDVRWFPRARALSLMAASLITGPSAWLAKTAHTAYMSGLDQIETNVTVEDTTAIVDLPVGVEGLSPDKLAFLEAQFTKTLVGSGLVQRVQLTVQGASVSSGEVLNLPAYPYTTAPLVAIVQGNVLSINNGQSSVLRLADEYNPKNFARIAIDSTQPATRLVGLNDAGTKLSVLPLGGGEEMTLYASSAQPAAGAAASGSAQASGSVRASRSALAAPSIDEMGWVWSADSAAPGKLLAINAETGEKVQLPAPDIAHGGVLQVAVSREGSRVVVLLAGDSTSHIAVFGVQRDPMGAPTGLGDPLWLGQDFTDVHDVSWMSDAKVLLLGTVGDGGVEGLYSLDIGGLREPVAGVSKAKSVTTGRGLDSAVVLTEDGTVQKFSGASWATLTPDATAIAFPG